MANRDVEEHKQGLFATLRHLDIIRLMSSAHETTKIRETDRIDHLGERKLRRGNLGKAGNIGSFNTPRQFPESTLSET